MTNYITSNVVLLLVSLLKIPEGNVIDFIESLMDCKIFTEAFAMIYKVTSCKMKYFLNVCKHEDYERVKACIDQRSAFLLKVSVGGQLQIHFLRGQLSFFTTTFTITGKYGNYVSSMLFRKSEWNTYEEMMEKDKVMIIHRLMHGVEFKGDKLNLLNKDATWYDILGLSATASLVDGLNKFRPFAV